MQGTPVVDLIVAVHDPTRPIDRAVGSVLDGTDADVRVTVVCHGIAAAEIAPRLARWTTVRFLEHRDGIRSPAGPFNAGLAAATAPWLSIMGSDDELAPGAIDSWLRTASRSSAEIVIAALRVGKRGVASPPVRLGRRRNLDGIRDRLAYRTAPLGLISAERFGDLRLTEGLTTGEDLAYSARLWNSGASIAFDAAGPAYLVHDDSPTRVTMSRRPVAAELAAVENLLVDEILSTSGVQVRSSLALRTLRMSIFSAVSNRPDEDLWLDDDVATLRRVTEAVLQWGPEAARMLARADADLVDGILAEAEPAELIRLAARRRRYGRPTTLIPRRVRDVLRREAPLRWTVASWAVARAQRGV